jgi:hypothetical protein
MKPTEKREQTGSDGQQSDEKEPAAGARGKRESDSQGEEGGDKAGGGEEGGGQKTPREGTGSAGQNQSADEGGGESSEKGTGNASPNAGTDAKASDRTGQTSGETHGRGTKQRPGQGEEPGGEAGNADNQSEGNSDSEPSNGEAQPSANDEQRQGDKETGRQGEGESASADGKNQSSDRAAEQNTEPSDQQGGEPTGDGGETGTDGPSRSSQGDAPPGDEANLDYARKQTDLVLDKLADQLNKKDVDDQLLKDLGWTEEDLRRFIERWNQRKEAARRNDPAGESANRELDEALRSLGLRPGALQQSIQKDDRQRDLREGFRGPVPAKYRDQLQKYNRGISRAGREEAE